MELAGDAASSGPGRRTNLQSIEDFMREQEVAETQNSAGTTADFVANPTKRQKKASLQEERQRLETEQKAKKATLEAEKKSIVDRANEAVTALGAFNWVGKLLEYRNAHPIPTGGLTYAEQVVGSNPQRFMCIALIHESSEHFGNSLSFSNKKDAKRYASKKAVDWLIEHSYMPADGDVKFPKPLPPPVVKVLGPTQSTTTSSIETSRVGSSTSYAGQVPELCKRLGFTPPSYELKKDSEYSAFWSGYAHFGGDPRIEGKVGEAKSVFGKSNAKEQIAIEVLSFLKDIERQRMEKGDSEDEEEDGKTKRESFSPELDDISGKHLKLEA